ncbi:hypothetical protein [Siphonobacter sp. SORGH_AS_0500]|uniref:hypothetical protein n=1 Tax=Siphonobacter sp. SORGH_AS_0500 TaxID=1864824 RepID=UPI002856C692|nr:hypothetical protein [Siphonobacter sp. SORGH_AS_0500]MDR6197212.1 hypothetical protein [Siphonobacter sp. SORGH_AS_0500]
MKIYSVLFLLILGVTACSPDDEDLASRVKGVYTTTHVTSNGKAVAISANRPKTHIALQPIDASHVKVIAEMDSLTGIPSFESEGTLSSGGQGITLIMDDENAATIQHDKMRMYLIKRDNTLVQIDAVRQ